MQPSTYVLLSFLHQLPVFSTAAFSLTAASWQPIRHYASTTTGNRDGSVQASPSSSSSSANHQPKEVKLKEKGKRLELLFNDGQRVALSAEYLRVMSPSVDTRTRKVIGGRRHVRILGVEPVGSYALRLKFDDLHQSGLYSWEWLHNLSTNKWHHMRSYLAQLQHAGLARDPKQPAKSVKARHATSAAAGKQL